MRYFAELDGKRLKGNPYPGLKTGADTPGSRQVALNAIALRHGYESWRDMRDAVPDANDIKLKPVPIDLAEHYGTLKGDPTPGQVAHIVRLVDQVGGKTFQAVLNEMMGVDDLSTQGQAAWLIDKLTAKLAPEFELDAQEALAEAYAKMVGEATPKQINYLDSLSGAAGFGDLAEMLSELADGKQAAYLTKGEASYLMDELKHLRLTRLKAIAPDMARDAAAMGMVGH